MSEFQKAAEKAAEEICDNVWIPDNEIPQFTERIAKHFSDLASTYAKLVELAVWCASPVNYDDPEAMANDYKKFEALKSDPRIVAAIDAFDKGGVA